MSIAGLSAYRLHVEVRLVLNILYRLCATSQETNAVSWGKGEVRTWSCLQISDKSRLEPSQTATEGGKWIMRRLSWPMGEIIDSRWARRLGEFARTVYVHGCEAQAAIACFAINDVTWAVQMR